MEDINKYQKSKVLKETLQFLQFFLVLSLGIVIGIYIYKPITAKENTQSSKFDEILSIIHQNYIDTVGLKEIEKNALDHLLSYLDPHSVYIPKEELSNSNEDLLGKFYGIGIEFMIQKDTLKVVSIIKNGPSEQAGLQSGDKIIKIDDSLFSGKPITNLDVLKKLKGGKNTKVKVSILRKGQKKLIDFLITRDEVKINSVEHGVYLGDSIAYIKINSFGDNTYNEFISQLKHLQSNYPINALILDLRQNFGGFLETAVSILDEIIAGEDLLVYTKGRKYTDEQYHARKKGIFEQGKIAVLIDEGSASASEILAGAVQDLDRGLVIGRRSFGKGLVQNQIQLSDGSALRLTVAKYFTPSGRNIQKPYKNVDYNAEVYERFKKGEFFSAHQLSDSIQKPDTGETKVYYTKNKRIVKASGGITPDYFIPLDTTNSFQNIQEIRSELDDFITENKDFIQSKIASVQGCVALNESIHKKDLFYNEFVAHLKKRNTLPVIKLINKQKLKELISIAISKRFYSEECYQHSIIYFDNFVNFTQKALQKKLPYVSKK